MRLSLIGSSVNKRHVYIAPTHFISQQFPPDEILEMTNDILRTREFENLKTVLDMYNMEIHPKKLKPDYHLLKTTVKGSIEQNLRTRSSDTRNRKIESTMMVKNQREQHHVLKGQGDCWQWKAIRAVIERKQLQIPARDQ